MGVASVVEFCAAAVPASATRTHITARVAHSIVVGRALGRRVLLGKIKNLDTVGWSCPHGIAVLDEESGEKQGGSAQGRLGMTAPMCAALRALVSVAVLSSFLVWATTIARE